MMKEYFNGSKLYGDDFTQDQIKEWFESEREAYANLGSANLETYAYGYDEINKVHGFSKLPKNTGFSKVLGIGAAFGHEFLPIIDRVDEVHILEPSDQLVSQKLQDKPVVYHDPKESGIMPFEDNAFDLITCFGTLHHIPNVSTVMSEMTRVLKPGGYMLLREPIMSMGDWRNKRAGLTSRERGIPINYFRKIISGLKLKMVSESFCFTMTYHFNKLAGQPLHEKRPYVYFDKLLSKIFSFNADTYHRQSFFSKMAPSSVFYILQKQ